MTRRKTLLLLLAGLGLLVVIPALRFSSFVNQPVAPPQPRIVHFPAGTGFADIARTLETEGIVADARMLKLLARWRELAGRIQAGEYAFERPATPDQVLARLAAGDVLRYRFTVPEGLTLREIAGRLEAEGRGDAERFLAAARDPELRRQWGIDGPDLEGYLFPETYLMARDMSEAQLVQAMLREFRKQLTADLEAAAQSRRLDRHQLVILASIVQKEAGNRAEMPLIASVFLNRLAVKMPLQADPTVIYGIENFDGNLTRRHLQTPGPYNTYRLPGLPAGPIANPGADALRAVAFPADSDYFYFVAKGDGTHIFAKTLPEHNANVRQYQLNK